MGTEAFTCPHCGTPQRQSPPPIPIVIAQPPKKKKIGLVGGCFLLFVFIPVLTTVLKQADFSTSTSAASGSQKKVKTQESERELSMRLYEDAKDAVRQRLKTPSTAKFPGTVFGAGEYKAYKMSNGTYRVTSWVDSQNGFGAMIRSQWVVNLREDGDSLQVTQVLIE